jgi:putative transposase
MGLLLVVMVHSAGVQDRDGARQLLQWAWCHLPRLLTIFADSAYVGAWHAWVDYVWGLGLGSMCRFLMQCVRRTPGMVGFHVLPKRWVVERTFAWFSRYRRLSKDYEYLPRSSEAFVYLASIHLMTRRLSRF